MKIIRTIITRLRELSREGVDCNFKTFNEDQIALQRKRSRSFQLHHDGSVWTHLW